MADTKHPTRPFKVPGRRHRWQALIPALPLCVCFLSGVVAAPAARFERMGPYGGTVRSLLVVSRNSKFLFLGTSDGQLFRSADCGGSWQLISPGLGQRQLVVDTLVEHPTDPNRIFAGAWDLRSDGGGLFESKDLGKSWNRIPLPQENVAVRGFAISRGDPARMIAGTGAGVFLTSDGGRTWRKTDIGSEAAKQVESVAIDSGDARRLFVGTWHLGYRSADFGKTWVRNDRGMIADSDVFSIAIDERNSANLYAGACTGLYRSVDGGASWVRLKVLPKSFLVRAHVVTVDPADSGRIYGGTTEGLFVSRNAGRTWSRITRPDLTIHAIQVDPSNPDILFLGTESSGILRSEDGGRTWAESNTGFVNRSIARIAADPGSWDRFVVGEFSAGKTGGLHVFESARGQWAALQDHEVPGAGLQALVVLPGDRGVLAGTARGIYHKRPGSTTWAPLAGPVSSLSVYDLACDSQATWIFAGTNDGIYRARMEELIFRKPPGYRLIPRAFSLLVSRSAPARIFAGTHMGILRSEDSGATWSFATEGIPDRTGIACLTASPAGEDHLFAGTEAGIFESGDGGRTWKRAADSRVGGDISTIVFLDRAGRRLMAADNRSGGILLSEDGGSSWEKIEDREFGSPVCCIYIDPLNPSIVYLGTRTEGVYRLHLNTGGIPPAADARRLGTGPESKPEPPK